MTDTGLLVSLTDEDAFRSNVVLDYTSRDFTAIRAQLIGLARGMMPEWASAGETGDFGTLLLELFAYMGDVLNFYIDRTASEAFLGTAVRRQSVLYIADMLGYAPIGQQAATVTLEFTLDPNAVAAVTLPIGLRVYNDADNADDLIVFETNEAVTLDPLALPPILTATCVATEGVMVRDALLGVSQGVPNGEFVIPNKGVVYNTVSIRSNEAGQSLPWTYVSDISLARPTQAAFTTFIDDLESTHILFGDNAAGRIPPVNSELFVSYRYGQGVEANSLAMNTITSIAASTAPGIDLWGVSVRNPSSPLGGTDPETVDAMRQSIPRAAARIKSRAVTLNDYADLALQVPGVAKSVSHGTVYTAVHVVIAPQDGVGTPASMQLLGQQVEAYMADKVMVGSTVYAEPDDVNKLWFDVYIRVLVHVTDGFNRTAVRQQVELLIRQALAFNTVDFGTRISIGQIYRTTLAVQGVDWVQLMWLNGVADIPVQTSPTQAPTKAQDQAMAPTTGNPPVPGTVKALDTPPLLIPRIYPPLTTITATVTNKALTTNVATLTTVSAHGLPVGAIILVAGVDATVNGQYTITAVTSTTLSYAKVATNVTSVASGGTITQVDPHAAEAENDFPGLTEDERTHDGL